MSLLEMIHDKSAEEYENFANYLLRGMLRRSYEIDLKLTRS
jgi:hypothetical protein